MTTFEVGSVLQQERLKQGISLQEIARQTKISLRFLQAIEANNIQDLPGAVFTRNFVRQFAVCLAIDPEPILAGLPRIDIEHVPLPDARKFAPSGSRDPRWAAAFSSFLWLAMAAGACVGGYAYLNHRQNRPSPKAATAAPKPASRPELVQPPISEKPEPVVSTSTPDPAATPAATPATPDVASQPVQVVLKAHEASWVQIFADGKNAFTGILNANDSRAIAANNLVKVTAGNAGGIEISLNGKPLDPLGPPGQVRTVRLTVEGPQIVMKTAQSTSAPL